MPVLGTTTPIEFAQDEWKLMLKAWRYLKPEEQLQDVRYRIWQAARQKYIPFPIPPDWGDLVKLPGIVPPALDPISKQKALDTFIIQIKTTPVPRRVRGLGYMINALDDAEDLVSFVALLGRVLIKAAPRIAGRMIPGLNVILTASDVLGWLTALTVAGAVGVGALSAGATGAAAGLLTVGAVKAVFKNELWEILRRSARKGVAGGSLGNTLQKLSNATSLPILPKGYKAPLALLAGKRLPTAPIRKGDIFEALQATDTLWGVGLSLGPIVGYIQDVMWAIQDTWFGPSRVNVAALGKEIAGLLPNEWVIQQQMQAVQQQRP